ncbi:DUF2752 domain-containing protein [Cellulomonas alba]|uniref:DUF2752 domain-containing protein n=1 Tax=Cellulomonas alba TaxID=3053467 RepID=A0ABT7SJK7_9CELL|nr:DUF2752 domain-containing protein [Cellulomonas alba]MDM7856365.1 DUF2752 domain-containing protein [Cellulomonas alba]
MVTLDGPGSAPAVPRPGGSAGERLRSPLAAGAVTAAGTLLVALRSPYAPGSYGFCFFHELTGLWCPLCGGMRATHDLARGDVASAWGMNPLWVVLAPLVVVGWALWVVRRAQGRPAPTFPRAARWALAALVVAFGVLRNVPALAPWLAP